MLAAEKGWDNIAQQLLNYGVNIEMQDKSGRTPLSYADENGDEHMVQLFLAHSANVAVKESLGVTEGVERADL